jgi:anti-anti-sigma regulatory factor
VLRITTEQDDHLLSLKLEGRLEGPWVEVLRRTWTDAITHDKGQKVSLDFGGVSFADSEGRQLLLTMQKKGVALTKLSGFMRETLERDGSSPNQSDTQD